MNNFYDNHPLNNYVVKIQNTTHGAKVIEAWEKHGVDVNGYDGNVIDAYYGLTNEVFTYWRKEELKDQKILTLNQLKNFGKSKLTFPRMMEVSDYEDFKDSKIRRVGYIEKEIKIPYPIVVVDKLWTQSWMYAREIQEVKEMTMEEICKELGREVKIKK